MYSLCVDRVSVGQEPACVKTCPTGAIRFGSKEEMKIYAEQRVADLKSVVMKTQDFTILQV